VRISIDVESAKVISPAFMAAPAMVMDELESAMISSLLYLEGQTAERTPVNMGTLRRSYTSEVSQFIDAVFGKMSSPLTYALPVEMGTRPHYPPLEPLINWVESKLGLYGDEAESAARGIQRKIGRFGTPGYGMARFALIDGQATISAEFADAAERITARLAGAGSAA
jgi:hypothetical protein